MPNVYQLRKALTLELRRELNSRFVTVPHPDHPFLLRAADILVGGEGNLSALFIPTRSEVNEPDLLRSRLILNRLALPPHTRCLLLIQSSQDALAQRFSADFADVLPWKSRSKAARIVSDPTFKGNHRD